MQKINTLRNTHILFTTSRVFSEKKPRLERLKCDEDRSTFEFFRSSAHHYPSLPNRLISVSLIIIKAC